MPTADTLKEEVIPLTLDGYAYSGRVVHQPDARLAPIVLVGGAFQHQGAWGQLERGCLSAATVITADLPGWGHADRLPAEYGFDFLADALARLLDKVTPLPVNMLAGSYGSPLAYQWARDYPRQVERMVLVGVASRLADATQEFFEEGIRLSECGSHAERAEFVQRLLDGMLCGLSHVTVRRQAAIVRCLSRLLYDLDAEDLAKFRDNTRRLLTNTPLPAEPPVRAPVLVAVGEHDTVTPPELSREIAAQCLNARFTTFRDADHLVHLERTADLVDLMLRFFAGETLDGLDYCGPVEYVTARASHQSAAS